ncbi:MAG: sugar ABC transporter permease [Clostridiales bacterium]|jgi:multiple sugar transport system permease protein|nr:sugar ABC transporter permease [Clostridiales bacterium]
MAAATQAVSVPKAKKSYANIIGWAFLLPGIVSFCLFKYYPIILGFVVSFFRVEIVRMPGDFIGFENYLRAFRDNFFTSAVMNNVQFLLISLALNFWVPIFLATLINEVRKGKTFIRTMYYIPAIAPGIAMMVLWKYIWQPDYGFANFIMRSLRLPEQLWLNDANLVKWCMQAPGLLMGGGMNMLIYLAALQDIPEEQHESALIDGAGFMRRITRISLPQILPIVSTMLVLAVIGAFNMFDNVKIMTDGGPSGATETIILYSFKQAYTFQDYGYALSLSTTAFFIIFLLTLLQMRLGRDRDAGGAGKRGRRGRDRDRGQWRGRRMRGIAPGDASNVAPGGASGNVSGGAPGNVSDGISSSDSVSDGVSGIAERGRA